MLQDYLCRRADKHMIPKVDNTNVDRSVATIHATVLACLRHTSQVSSHSKRNMPFSNAETGVSRSVLPKLESGQRLTTDILVW